MAGTDDAYEAELKKPSVEVVVEGTAEDAAKAWEKAAFEQATRANRLAGELRAIRDRLNVVLAEDDKHDD